MANIPPDVDNTTVWAGQWNPPDNEWDPNATPHETWGVEALDHTDDQTAEPMSEQYGHGPSGTTPDARENLLTDVQNPRTAAPLPTQTVHHIVETVEVGSAVVRPRTVRVVGNTTETPLLEENPNRERAIIKLVTTNGVIIIGAARQGGNPQFNATPTGPSNWWYQATGDPVLVIETTAAVVAYGVAVAGAVDVCIWEELRTPSDAPGLV